MLQLHFGSFFFVTGIYPVMYVCVCACMRACVRVCVVGGLGDRVGDVFGNKTAIKKLCSESCLHLLTYFDHYFTFLEINIVLKLRSFFISITKLLFPNYGRKKIKNFLTL